MNESKVDKLLEETFNVPLRLKIYVWLAASLVIAIGVSLSVIYENWYWLGRFGALLVVLSLLVESSKLPDKFMSKVFESTQAVVSEVIKMQVVRQSHLYGLNGNESEEQINEIASKELRKRLSEFKGKSEKAMSKNIRALEFKVASIGTVLWAFADLINIVFGYKS